MSDKRRHGPVEAGSWPDKLSARVVSPGSSPRIRGYAVEEDLSLHYSWPETIFLTLTGRFPEANEAARFEVALLFLSATTVAEAPAHAAMLSQLCGARHSAVSATGAMALAEQARFVCDRHEGLWEWSSSDEESSPTLECAPGEEDEARLSRLREALEARGLPPPREVPGGCRLASLLLLLIDCGLTKRWQVETAIVMARLPTVVAEAHGVRSRLFRKYPMDLPAFEYVEEEGP